MSESPKIIPMDRLLTGDSANPSPENESGLALTMPMRYVRSPQTRRVPRTSSASVARTLCDICEPPVP